MQPFRRFPIWCKLALVACPFLVPIGLLGYAYVQSAWATVHVARQEKKGLEFVVPVAHLLEQVAQHRGLVNGYLNGDAGMKSRVEQKQTVIAQQIQLVDLASARVGAEFKVDGAWAVAKTEWQLLQEKALRLKPAASFAEHTRLIHKLFELYMDAAEASTLPLDPDPDSYYLQDTMITRLYWVTETVGQLRGEITGALARKSWSAADKSAIAGQIAHIQTAREMIGRNMESAFRARSSLHQTLDAAYVGFNKANDDFVDYLNAKVSDPATPEVTPREYFEAATRPVAASYVFFDAIAPVLVTILDERIAAASSRVQTTLIGVGLTLVLSLVFAALISRGITAQIGSINHTFAQVGIGNFEARATVLADDELGIVAASLNGMLDNLVTLLEAPGDPGPESGDVVVVGPLPDPSARHPAPESAPLVSLPHLPTSLPDPGDSTRPQ